jgi:DNA-binding GntR family transcriptional regulator
MGKHIGAADIATVTRSVRDVVYQKLKEAILQGTHKPGVHLREREVAYQFQISTTPVKEALRLLEQEGLVVTRPRVGTYVCNDIMNSVVEIRLARSALEGVAARLAAMKASQDEVEQLRRSLRRIETCAKARTIPAMIEACEQFDSLVQKSAKNDYISKQIESIRLFDLCSRRKITSHVDEMDLLYAEHREIYEKIAEHDPEGAEEVTRAHVRRSTERAVKDAP